MLRLLCAAGCAAIFSATFSLAATTNYAASSYSPTGHSLYLFHGSGSQRDFHFETSGPNAGLFSTNEVDAATLSGRVISEANAANGFDISVTFDNAFGFSPAYKSENGAASEPSDNYYLNLASGVMTGFGAYAGHVYDIMRRPPFGPYATQIGTGSNAKSPTDYGLASWIFVDARDVNACLWCNGSDTQLAGDFNLILTELPPPPPPNVPLPASLWLLGAALGGGALYGRKKRKS